jgi:murein L,D-transpeptidase YcbB/YkuD
MSEYAHSPVKTPKSLQEEALFDDTIFDDVEKHMDKLGISVAEAQYALGVEAPRYERPIAPEEGVSVDLGARALALSNIMDTYNQLNKLAGASQAGDFAARYSRPNDVYKNMTQKAERMLKSNKNDFETLNATDKFVAAGNDPDLVQLQEDRIKRELTNKYGPGKAYAPERAKAVRQAINVAKKVNQQKTA